MAVVAHSGVAFAVDDNIYQEKTPVCKNRGPFDSEIKRFFEDAVDCRSDSPSDTPLGKSLTRRRHRDSTVSTDSRWLTDPAPTPLCFEHFSDPEPTSPPPVVSCFSREGTDDEDSMFEWREMKWRGILSGSIPIPLWRIPWPVFFLDDFDLDDDGHTRMEMINFVYALASTFEGRLSALERELPRWTTQAIAPYALLVRLEDREECFERAAKVHSLLWDILYEEKWHSAFRT